MEKPTFDFITRIYHLQMIWASELLLPLLSMGHCLHFNIDTFTRVQGGQHIQNNPLPPGNLG